MLPFGNIISILPRRFVKSGLQQPEQLVEHGVKELARRAIPGVLIVPACLLLSLLASSFCRENRELCWILAGGMTIGAIIRGCSIYALLYRSDIDLHLRMRLFSYGCLFMALTWGMLTAIFISHYQGGFPVLLVFVLSSGIGAGIVANFSIWRNLAIIVLLLAFLPAVVSGLLQIKDGRWVLIVAMLFFLGYVFFQIHRWYIAYWESLVTAHRCRQQASAMAEMNSALAELVQREQEARHEVERGREKMHDLFDHSRDGILICQLSGVIVEANLTVARLIRKNRQELLGTYAQHLFAPDSRDLINVHWSHVQRSEESSFETILGVPESTVLPVSVNLRQVKWQEEHIVFVAISDISKQKEAQELLVLTQRAFSSSEEYRQRVLPNIDLPMFCKDMKGRYLTVNTAFQRLCSCRQELFRGKTDAEIFPDEINHFFSVKDNEIIATGNSVDLEGAIVIDGLPKELWLHKFALYDDDCSIIGVGGICSDRMAIKNAIQTARRANQAEAEFFANMSHELRTPLHSLISFGRLGRRKAMEGTREKLQSYFTMIVTNGERFLELLNNFLTLTTLEARRTRYHFELHDLREDVHLVAEEFRGAAEERNLTLRVDCPPESSQSRYDRTKLFQVIRNLLANSMRFSSEHSEIVLRLQKDILATGGVDYGAWKVSVIDHGIGITPGEVDLVFGEFVQGEQKGGDLGVGLGLALCKRIVEDHGGIIWAERNEFGGATLSFLLPQLPPS